MKTESLPDWKGINKILFLSNMTTKNFPLNYEKLARLTNEICQLSSSINIFELAYEQQKLISYHCGVSKDPNQEINKFNIWQKCLFAFSQYSYILEGTTKLHQ